MPSRKVHCVPKYPKRLAMKIFRKSFRSTFSFLVNKDMIQNREPAPSDLRVNKESGVKMWELVRSLVKIILKPKMQYAPNAARCPPIYL